MAPVDLRALQLRVEQGLLGRNDVTARFFEREAEAIAAACLEMAARFLQGGRLVAFGRGAAATDAQHVSVQFVHPVIAGKRALPAVDVSAAFEAWAPALVRPDDIVMGFGSAEGDAAVTAVLWQCAQRGAQTFNFAGGPGDYRMPGLAADAYLVQETTETLYHALWEGVHVYLEHRERCHDADEAGFLHPFRGCGIQALGDLVAPVAGSIRQTAREVVRLRELVADRGAATIAHAVSGMRERLRSGGTLFMFGNGGSAAAANDWVLDCIQRGGRRAVPAVSLAMEPAVATAVADDVGVESVFVRQLIAQAKSGDVAVALSTCGGSANVIAALVEARRRGLFTVALLGHDGGEIVRRGLADAPIVVPSDDVPRIQEVQASVYHVMTDLLCEPAED